MLWSIFYLVIAALLVWIGYVFLLEKRNRAHIVIDKPELIPDKYAGQIKKRGLRHISSYGNYHCSEAMKEATEEIIQLLEDGEKNEARFVYSQHKPRLNDEEQEFLKKWFIEMV